MTLNNIERLKNDKDFLKRTIGISRDDFKYFGDSFEYYEDFCQYQHKKIDELNKKETRILIQYVKALQTFNTRHIDFYNTSEHFIVDGLYFHKNGKLITYSRP